MKTDFFKFFLVITIFACILIVFLYSKQNATVTTCKEMPADASPFCENTYAPCLKIGKETKELSAMLNDALMQVGRLTCESSKIEVSQRGGWCGSISGKNSTLHLTDHNLATEFSRFLKGKRVASFGDGPGQYKKIISDLKEVSTYDAYDGAPYCEDTTDGHVKHLDLSVPVYHLPLYDWVISLEVAEHVPKEFEQTFIDNLTRHAKEGIILSWAVPGQLGHSHINNQPFDYVKEQLEKRGFKYNENHTQRIKNAANFAWLKRNTYVYVRSA